MSICRLSTASALALSLGLGVHFARADDTRSNALQDCWTSNVNIELESYQFANDENTGTPLQTVT